MREAELRLQGATQRMRNPQLQERARATYRDKRWEVTNTICCPVDVHALETFMATPAASVVPATRKGKANNMSYNDMLSGFLPHVT